MTKRAAKLNRDKAMARLHFAKRALSKATTADLANEAAAELEAAREELRAAELAVAAMVKVASGAPS